MALPDLGSSLPDIALRTGIMYLFLLVALRLGGKREVGQLSIFDLIVLVVIADAIQNAMIGDNTSIWGGIVAAIVLISLDRVLQFVTARSKPIRRVLVGEPRLIVRDGELLRRAMREEAISMDDLKAAMRAEGIAQLRDVRMAVLETDGRISIVPQQPGSPASVDRSEPARIAQPHGRF
jgi:uncharacterized membrane protein YcaP (DUF421 family)